MDNNDEQIGNSIRRSIHTFIRMVVDAIILYRRRRVVVRIRIIINE